MRLFFQRGATEDWTGGRNLKLVENRGFRREEALRWGEEEGAKLQGVKTQFPALRNSEAESAKEV